MIEAQRLLVIAPHPDDEVIGCGGTIALAAERGADIHVLVVFDGAAGDPSGKFPDEGYVARRRREAQAAGRHLGVSRYTFWELPEGHSATEEDLTRGAERLAQLVDEWRPDMILAPWAGDDHRDHRGVARAVQQLMRSQSASAEQCEYWGFEVWSPLKADYLVDVSSVWEHKIEAIGLHETQLAYNDLVSKITQLASRYNAGLLEAFQRIGSES